MGILVWSAPAFESKPPVCCPKSYTTIFTCYDRGRGRNRYRYPYQQTQSVFISFIRSSYILCDSAVLREKMGEYGEPLHFFDFDFDSDPEERLRSLL